MHLDASCPARREPPVLQYVGIAARQRGGSRPEGSRRDGGGTDGESQEHGYLEDRRPAANADPYLVSVRMLETVCSAASQAASHGVASPCGAATQSGNNGSARRGTKGGWKTSALSPFPQPATDAVEP